jgi:MFS family permease
VYTGGVSRIGAEGPESAAFRFYLAGLASWFTSFGMQVILFPWLVAVVLREPPGRVGIAQMALMAPSIALMLLGGAVADRADCRALLLRYQLVAALPPLTLAAVIAGGGLSYAVLIGYGLAMGTLSALVVPARDALLTRVIRGGLPRAVAVTTATQLVAQLVGIILAGAASVVGAESLLVAQAATLALSALAVSRLAPAPPQAVHAPGESRLAAMRDGLREAVGDERIRSVVIAMLAVGVLYVGAFLVLLPVMVRDIYRGGAAELSLVNMGFWGGTIVATVAQVRFGNMRRPGRATILALAWGAVVLAAMAVPGPLWVLALLCVAWGGGAGVVMTQGRTIVQLAAPESHRARILALFQLGFMGGAPIGALVMGYLAGIVGPRPAAIYPAAAMILVLLFLLVQSRLWHDRATS